MFKKVHFTEVIFIQTASETPIYYKNEKTNKFPTRNKSNVRILEDTLFFIVIFKI